jgi:hypothetical protein
MRYELGFTHSDMVFMRAVELGCNPIPGSSQIIPLWRCTCRDWLHAAHETTIITRESLDLLQDVMRKRAAK